MIKFKLDKEYRQALGMASVMGYHLVSGPLVGYFFGWYLDKLFETKPWLTYILLVFGIVAGFKMIFEDVRKLNKVQEEAEKAKQNKGKDQE